MARWKRTWGNTTEGAGPEGPGPVASAGGHPFGGESRFHEEARDAMRIGRWDVRPLGGGWGCLAMIAISVLASLLLTLLLNVCVRPS